MPRKKKVGRADAPTGALRPSDARATFKNLCPRADECAYDKKGPECPKNYVECPWGPSPPADEPTRVRASEQPQSSETPFEAGGIGVDTGKARAELQDAPAQAPGPELTPPPINLNSAELQEFKTEQVKEITPLTPMEQIAQVVLKQSEAIKQLQDLYTSNMSALFKRQEALEAKQVTGGADWMNNPIVKTIGDLIVKEGAKWLTGGGGEAKSVDPFLSLLTEDAKKEVSNIFVGAVKTRFQTILDIQKLVESGKILEYRVKEKEEQPK